MANCNKNSRKITRKGKEVDIDTTLTEELISALKLFDNSLIGQLRGSICIKDSGEESGPHSNQTPFSMRGGNAAQAKWTNSFPVSFHKAKAYGKNSHFRIQVTNR